MSSAFDWRAKAACRDKDPELFFPVGNTGAAYQQIEEAKAVCRTCKVIDACLKCALDTPFPGYADAGLIRFSAHIDRNHKAGRIHKD